MGEAFSSAVRHVAHDWPTGAEELKKKKNQASYYKV